MLLFLFLLACAGNTPADCPTCPECPEPEPAATGGTQLEAWEADILGPTIDELRGGINTWGEQPFGVCNGKRDCDEYLGAEPGMLPEGSFFIRSELKVPGVGDDWKATFAVDCVTHDKRGNESPQAHEKTYTVKYTGKERAYRLQPLWKIQSPHPGGKRVCDFSLTPIRPDGQAGDPWKGHYETPAPTE